MVPTNRASVVGATTSVLMSVNLRVVATSAVAILTQREPPAQPICPLVLLMLLPLQLPDTCYAAGHRWQGCGALGSQARQTRPRFVEMEMMKERFAKLLLREDMSGGGKRVCTALAISNAITNLSIGMQLMKVCLGLDNLSPSPYLFSEELRRMNLELESYKEKIKENQEKIKLNK